MSASTKITMQILSMMMIKMMMMMTMTMMMMMMSTRWLDLGDLLFTGGLRLGMLRPVNFAADNDEDDDDDDDEEEDEDDWKIR